MADFEHSTFSPGAGSSPQETGPDLDPGRDSMAGAGRMSLAQAPWSLTFRREREPEWNELDTLIARVLSSGLQTLSGAELRKMPVLYRRALTSLAVARKTALDRTLVEYLDALTARAYVAIYGSKRPRAFAFWNFFFERLPGNTLRLAPEIILATSLFVIGVIVAAALFQLDSHWYYAFMPEAMSGDRTPASSTESLRATLYDTSDKDDFLAVFSSFLFVHNAGIGLVAFALGFAAGFPSAFLMFYNGLVLGAFGALFHSRGLLLSLLGWILPHGIPEIGAVILCGAAGMSVGRALMFPGRLSVRASLARAGRKAASVAAFAVLLFAYAGFFEGILRQLITDDRVRFLLAGVNALLALFWMALGLRAANQPTEEDYEAGQ